MTPDQHIAEVREQREKVVALLNDLKRLMAAWEVESDKLKTMCELLMEPSVTKDSRPVCRTKMQEVLCGKPAVAVMHWPGAEALPVCAECLTRGKNVAWALGFTLHFTDLPLGEQP